jgi:uncharacterized membrane protein
VSAQSYRWAMIFLLMVAVGCSGQIPEDIPSSSEDCSLIELLEPGISLVVTAIETLGIGIIVVGALLTSIFFLRDWATDTCPFALAYKRYRERLGQAILLGLEFLVAGDIIGTVAIDLTFYSIGTLGAVVVVRTFLSFALEVEIHGRWPWNLDDERRFECFR